ncbi:MAG: HlyC/CorC family transporter [Acidobacteria bacterium]|nr:HlyC/CorC family transporter [Acidobacteriota bacterium]
MSPPVSLLVHIVLIALLTFLLVFFAYLHRAFQEKGWRATRRLREHLEYFHEHIAPRFGMDQRRATQSFSLLAQLMLVLLALGIGSAANTFAKSAAAAVFETAFFVVLEILLLYQLFPYLLLLRSRGDWVLPCVRVARVSSYIIWPLLGVYGFGVSLLHLTDEEESSEEETPSEAIEELVEVGQERGILAQEDVRLIASVVQFADKTVKEVMTPRPEIVAIQADAGLAELRQLLREKKFSRVPVYGQNLDDIVGIAFVRDLLDVPDGESQRRSVRELMRLALFVPETKPLVELLREMQREYQQMAMVIDEYGSVAGLVTLEDLVEEIVGEISDVDQVRRAEIVKESDTSYLVRGGAGLERLREALDRPLNAEECSTVAGLVHSWFGYVPKPGEHIERDGLRFEVLEATPRRVVRLRVSVLPPAVAAKPRGKGKKAQAAH